MAQAGILGEDDRVELLEGEIVEMAPIGSRHASCVDRLNRLFSLRVGEATIIRVQSPVRLGERSEPQPDLTLLRPHPDFYVSAHPGPRDIFLLVEVAEASASLDRDVKCPLYARAGVPEVWLVDLPGECIEVYRKPAPQGYQEVRQVRRTERVAPQAFPEIGLTGEEILG
jgi:Uma2 family endonuclease